MSTLTGRLTNLPTLALQEREKVDVDFVLVRAREPLRRTGIDLEAGVLDLRWEEVLTVADFLHPLESA